MTTPERPRDLYPLLYPAFKAGLDLRFKQTIEGVENLPEGPALYVSNHVSAFDSLTIAATITDLTGRRVRFGAKAEYFQGLGVDNKGKLGRSARFLMENTGQIYVDRTAQGRAALTAYERMKDEMFAAFDRGDSVALHPEGTRSYDGRVYKFRSGGARIALEYGASIVPVGLLYGAPNFLGRVNQKFAIGETITPESLQEPGLAVLSSAAKIRYVNDVAEARVAELIGAERVGEFAEIHKDATKEPQE